MTEKVTKDEVEWIRRSLKAASVRVVRRLHGGQHADVFEVAAGRERFVFRRFPAGDDAVRREIAVLGKLNALEEFVPRLVASETNVSAPMILTSYVIGEAAAPDVEPAALAAGLGRALAAIHAQDGVGLPDGAPSPRGGRGPCAVAIGREWPELDMSDPVLTHHDFWSGNTLWSGDKLTGVIDWSGACRGPRGVDLAWCRQDLALLFGVGNEPAIFLAAYEQAAGTIVPGMRLWDIHAGARAEDRVEEWAPNYAGVGRPGLTGAVLRRRLDAWNAHLLGHAG